MSAQTEPRCTQCARRCGQLAPPRLSRRFCCCGVSQDFWAAFGGLGDDERHISTVDADGVCLVAVQALNQKLDRLALDRTAGPKQPEQPEVAAAAAVAAAGRGQMAGLGRRVAAQDELLESQRAEISSLKDRLGAMEAAMQNILRAQQLSLEPSSGTK